MLMAGLVALLGMFFFFVLFFRLLFDIHRVGLSFFFIYFSDFFFKLRICLVVYISSSGKVGGSSGCCRSCGSSSGGGSGGDSGHNNTV